MRIYSVYDEKMDGFGIPMFFHSDGVAIRSFSDEVNRRAPDNNLNRHPDDFSLFFLGIFNDKTGEIVPEVRLVVTSRGVFCADE